MAALNGAAGHAGECAAAPAIAPVQGRHYVLGMLCASYTLSILDRYAMGILAEPIKRDLHLSDTMLGLLTGAVFGLFYITLAIPVARLADRSSRRNLVAAALAVWSLFTMACGMAASAAQLAWARVFVGVGEAGASPPAQAMIADLYPPGERGRALGWFASGANLGVVLAYAVAGTLSAAYGWRTAFIALGLPGLVLAAMFLLTVREPVRGRYDAAASAGPQPSLRDVLQLLWQRRALRYLLAASTCGVAASSVVMLWLPACVMRIHGVTEAKLGPMLGLIFGVLGFAGAVGGGWLSDRLGGDRLARRARLAGAMQVMVWPALAGALLAPDYAAMLLLLTVPGLLVTAPMGISMAAFQTLAPASMRATATAVALFSANVAGMVAGPFAVGYASDALGGAGGLRLALLLFSGLFGLSAWLYFRAARHIDLME